MNTNRKLLYVVNVDWFFLSHRLAIAQAALKQGYEVHIATALTGRLRDLEDCGFVVHPLSLERSTTGLVDAWQVIRQIFIICKKVRPDIVHLITIKPVVFGGVAARLAKVPAMVAAIPGLGFVFLADGIRADIRRRVVSWLYRLALGHNNTKVIFQNPEDLFNVTCLARLNVSKTALIRGSGVALDSFAAMPLPEGPPVVLLAARMLRDKGVREFVEAAQFLRKGQRLGGNKVRFILVGEPDPGNPTSLTQAELDQWQRNGDVELWGHREDMPAVLSAATIVVLPSYSEGLPKVLLEAAACGRPVVTTDVPGCRDAIVPGETGLLVPAKDYRALAEAIFSLLNDPEKCSAMGRAGRVLAEQSFDVNNVVKVHLQIYDELLAKASL